MPKQASSVQLGSAQLGMALWYEAYRADFKKFLYGSRSTHIWLTWAVTSWSSAKCWPFCFRSLFFVFLYLLSLFLSPTLSFSPPPCISVPAPPLPTSKLPHSLPLVDDLMSLACSSALYGGGTNQELALHCLHECGGNVLVSRVTHPVI